MADEEKKSDSVKVAIRVRPLSAKENENEERCIVDIEPNVGDEAGSVTIHDPEGRDHPAQFAFDIVFGLDTPQTTVFEQVGHPAVDSTLKGYDGTIFAYGQTGSGKSWSMTGAAGELRGIIPRVNEEIFERIEQLQAEVKTRKFLVMCSFFEIYNEIIFDLLNPVQDRSKLGAGLQIKEHPILGIYVKDLQEIVVSDEKKLEKLMTSGIKNRTISSTMMNSVSSRSHSVFAIKVHQKDDADKSRNVFAKLNLVDLAGSERQNRTGATGQTLKEGANINKSLSALGLVINALVETANGKKVFVPFRNSKLTRVLQESLGGNSLCTMLAALSPAACNYEETVSTLRYANRAKAIKVTATKNEELSQITLLNAEIEELKRKLDSAESVPDEAAHGLLADEERQDIKAKFESQLADMEKMVSSTWEEKERLSKHMESQLSKAVDEQRKQAKAMMQECRKRFRLLQEQGDLELSIRALLDTVQSLPLKALGDEPLPLLSGELPRMWLELVADISEVATDLKQQQTVALVFHGAFSEDLRLWVEGEEASDYCMARTGARRALKKLETLRREYEQSSALERQGRQRAQDFVKGVQEVRRCWHESDYALTLARLREGEFGFGFGGFELTTSFSTEGGPSHLNKQILEDVGRIMQLIEQQAETRAAEFAMLSAIQVRSNADLVLRGMKWSPAGVVDKDIALLKSIASPDSPKEANAEQGASKALRPREERPLHEWTPDDAEDSVEGAELALARLVDLGALNKKKTPTELLERPPPKFVHDVALMVRVATGFDPSLSAEWPQQREGRKAIIQHIVASVMNALGLEGLVFDSSEILQGKAVPRTLHLLQLLAIAAARAKHEADLQEQEGGFCFQRRGLTRAGDMLRLLDSISRCVKLAIQHQNRPKDFPVLVGTTSPTHELESRFRDLHARLRQEMQRRAEQDERQEQLQQGIGEAQQALEDGQASLTVARQRAAASEAKKEHLRRQVATLREGLLRRAERVDTRSQRLALVKEELERVTAQSAAKKAEKLQLADEVQKLQRHKVEADSERDVAALGVQSAKTRHERAESSSGVRDLSEDVVLLRAKKQQQEVRVMALEERVRAMVEAEDADRHRHIRLLEEHKSETSRNDDVQMHLQVITEERDALRDGMVQLWQKKSAAYEELGNVDLMFVHFTERLFELCDRARVYSEQVLQYESMILMVQDRTEPSSRAGQPKSRPDLLLQCAANLEMTSAWPYRPAPRRA